MIKKNLFPILLMVFGVFLMRIGDRMTNAKLKEQTDLIESLNAELKTWKAKDGLNYAKIQTIKTKRTKDFFLIKSNDSIIKELQETVEKYKKELKRKGSVTIVKDIASIKTSSKTEVTGKKNTFPIYKSKFDLDGWVKGDITSNKDSTTINLKIKNSYSVIIGEENQGLLKRPKSFVEVINKNPFTETKSLRTYEVTNVKRRKISFGPVVGVTFKFDGTFQPFIGIGLQYRFLNF